MFPVKPAVKGSIKSGVKLGTIGSIGLGPAMAIVMYFYCHFFLV